MRARNSCGLKEGDVCAIEQGAILCGGPRTGTWKEHRARAWRFGDVGRFRVVKAYKDHDMITDSHFSEVAVVPLETLTIHCHGRETSPGSHLLALGATGRLPAGFAWPETTIPDDESTMRTIAGEILSRAFGVPVHPCGGAVTGGDDRETDTRSVFFEVEVAAGGSDGSAT